MRQCRESDAVVSLGACSDHLVFILQKVGQANQNPTLSQKLDLAVLLTSQAHSLRQHHFVEQKTRPEQGYLNVLNLPWLETHGVVQLRFSLICMVENRATL